MVTIQPHGYRECTPAAVIGKMIENPASVWHCNIARWLQELMRWKMNEAQGIVSPTSERNERLFTHFEHGVFEPET
jgi:hypothetical protein